ncbi:Vht1 protein [Starmerella bacillaris]|uniref:Vht1 protein n=1 Tax=Starmerella bacillaris TaxID=1247836 RepID=A0AAV5RMK9_STABA|nr:Vht1 protein [Starmerella bacillaris]
MVSFNFRSKSKKEEEQVTDPYTVDESTNSDSAHSYDAENNVIDDEFERQRALEVVNKADEVRAKHWYTGFVRLFIWYPSSLPRYEKLFLFKLDICLLLYVCASYFTKALDKSNITKAYNANMDVEIGFTGNNLAYAKSLYSAGYIVSMALGTMFVTRPKARYMLPLLETIWGVLTFCQAACNTPSQILALRFLVGLAEGPIFPSVVYTIGSWYKRDEVYRRVMAFSVSSSLGGIFSGFLQSAAYSNLSGKGGLSGWKWGFIIDGIFTVPIALIGFFMYPGSLDQAKNVRWLTKDEMKLARRRMVESGVKPAGKIKWSLIKRVFLGWRVHYFTAFWVLLNVVALPDGTGFDLWLKARSDIYTVSNRENYPSIQSAIGIVAQFVLAGLSDTFSPYIFLTFVQVMFVISYSSLVYWKLPIGYRWFCFMIISLDSTDQAIISGQINRSLRRNAEERAFVIGFSDAVSQAMSIWTNIVFFPTVQAPEFRNGYIASLTGALLMLFLPIGNYFGERYDNKKYALEDLKNAENASVSSEEIIESGTEKAPYELNQEIVTDSASE